ncbi:MAG: hypothetical protein M0R80_14165 [Proteobacteria bacterium]|jgi:hypothetical protein|nr:hypothetical protein [Pseudomonadota bacterium]
MARIIIWLGFAGALALGACSDGGGSGGTPDSGTDDLLDPPALAPYDDTAPLTELGVAAVAAAPAWLRRDLAIALRKQTPERADELAALVTDAADPRTVDEIAFSIAHTSPEVLEVTSFYPELLALNAELIYAHDAAPDYVELVDTGVPGTDDDFWTTATYTYFQKGGDLVQRTVDRDIYYWFVVHPKMEDENPWFIDAWSVCSSGMLECAATPDEGWFWREFLWEAAADTCPEEGLCPTLDEWLPGLEMAWNGRAGGDAEGAIKEIVELMRFQPVEGDNWLDFGAYGERSIQPNRIYGLGRGNCGEWADMTTALARTALIPNANATPTSWDHTWNAFFDGIKWIEWEPVNYAIDADYSGWGASFEGSHSFYITRGDGLVLLQTPDYRDDVFTMEIVVHDSLGTLIPGASVSVWAPIPDSSGYWSYAGEAPTDADGVATFPLVAMGSYAVRIETPIGSIPAEANSITYASDGIAVGETDVKEYSLEVQLPWPLGGEAVGFEGEAAAAMHLRFADLGARFTPVGQRFGTTYTVEAPAPEIQAWLVDEANLALLEAGEPFEAGWEGTASDADVEIPLDGVSYLVLSNAAQISTAVFGTLSVTVEPLVDGAWTGPATPLELPYEILPGGRIAVSITPAE